VKEKNMILGAGMTGLAAGVASGFPVFEAADTPGGICSSYYIRSGEKERLMQAPDDDEAYRFEIGGGHWIFGGDSAISHFIRKITSVKSYARYSSVYFNNKDLYVPYPLQNHLRFLNRELAVKALSEITGPKSSSLIMKEWLRQNFGPTLCDLFFYPFHELYTAGLYDRIAPQDSYKSPVDPSLAIQGAFDNTSPVGYNATFLYPENGLNALSQEMAIQCDVHYGKRAIKIDPGRKEVFFDDDSVLPYNTLISTLPLNKMMQLDGLSVNDTPDPYTSVIVLNIGAKRGSRCPDDQWVYIPESFSDFHRIGFYSNVDPSFLPHSVRKNADRVSIYVERAYMGGSRPSETEINQYTQNVIKELKEWSFIEDIEVVDPTWIDVAYTWSWPGSSWKQQSIEKLEQYNIYQVGRYGRWTFQGIAKSIHDGLVIGAALK